MTDFYRGPLFAFLIVLTCGSGCDLKSQVGSALKAAAPPAQDAPGTGPGTFDPRELMPLAGGNTWTYAWSSPAGKPGGKGERAVACIRSFKHGEKGVTVRGYAANTKAHEETYTIDRQEGDHFFFSVKSTASLAGVPLRDGRYGDAAEASWTWWDKRNTGSMDLTESIKHRWDEGLRGWLLDAGERESDTDLPFADDNVLHIEFERGSWGTTHVGIEIIGSSVHREYVTSKLVSVAVPAGTYDSCVEVITTVRESPEHPRDDDVPADKLPVAWTAHTFYARRVGMVREYQVTPDGRTTYEMVLLKAVFPAHGNGSWAAQSANGSDKAATADLGGTVYK